MYMKPRDACLFPSMCDGLAGRRSRQRQPIWRRRNFTNILVESCCRSREFYKLQAQNGQRYLIDLYGPVFTNIIVGDHVAVLTAIIAVVYAIQGSFGMALLAALVASCCLLNTTRPGADRAASRSDLKRFLGIR